MNIYKNKQKTFNPLNGFQNEWKRYGLYYVLPISKNKNLYEKMQYKLAYKNQASYYDDILKDVIYVYSNGFQKDCFERIKTIQMMKKHEPRVWINKETNKYVNIEICDFARISYKEHNILRFVVKSRLIQSGFWLVQYSPRKNYREFLRNLVKKKKLLCFFTQILSTMKKKLYSFFKLSTTRFFTAEPIYFIKKFWVFNFRFVFVTSSGYRFMRKGCYWFTLNFFTGLYWIIKGPAKDGLKFIVHISYPLYTYYNTIFLEKWTDDYFIYSANLLYKFFSDFAFESVQLTYIEQKIKYRRSNWYFRRLSKYIVKRFRRSQNMLYNYYQIKISHTSNNFKIFGNYLFFYKYFNLLEEFNGMVFKDIDELLFIKEYSIEEKVMIFQSIVYFLQINTPLEITQQAFLKNFNTYLKKKLVLINLNIVKIVKNFFIFKQFFIEGFIFNNINENFYQNELFEQRKLLPMYKHFQTVRGHYLFFSKNISFDYIKNRYKKYIKFISSEVLWKYKTNFVLTAMRHGLLNKYSFIEYWFRFNKLFYLRKYKHPNLDNYLTTAYSKIKIEIKKLKLISKHFIFNKNFINYKKANYSIKKLKEIKKDFKKLLIIRNQIKLEIELAKEKKLLEEEEKRKLEFKFSNKRRNRGIKRWLPADFERLEKEKKFREEKRWLPADFERKNTDAKRIFKHININLKIIKRINSALKIKKLELTFVSKSINRTWKRWPPFASKSLNSTLKIKGPEPTFLNKRRNSGIKRWLPLYVKRINSALKIKKTEPTFVSKRRNRGIKILLETDFEATNRALKIIIEDINSALKIKEPESTFVSKSINRTFKRSPPFASKSLNSTLKIKEPESTFVSKSINRTFKRSSPSASKSLNSTLKIKEPEPTFASKSINRTWKKNNIYQK